VQPRLSVVVVAYDMARELPRTLRSLAPRYQQGITADEYEVIVMDNGSPLAIEPGVFDAFAGSVRHVRVDDAPPGPQRAANLGIEMAQADLVGLLIDGARMASPGLLAHALQAARLSTRPVVATLGFHLGPVRHMDAATAGYDQAREDALLIETEWESDGYRLFEISTLAASSARGWFAPMGESNGLFMPNVMWQELGGLDERFALRGGGLANHDLYRRACALENAQLIVLLGEATFHQIHGGAATSGRITWDEMQAEYVALRGTRYAPPETERTYFGSVPGPVLSHLQASIEKRLRG
jgi:hypothetical protein